MSETLLTPPSTAAGHINQFLRERFGLPDDWRWVRLDRDKGAAPDGWAKVVGAICPLRPDGSVDWRKRDKATERTLFFSLMEFAAWEALLAAKLGVCVRCWGEGKTWTGRSQAKGTRYQTCGKCDGTGKPAGVPAVA